MRAAIVLNRSTSAWFAARALELNLGMVPLAEGIETEGEWRFLVEHGCELGQGFYFSRPVPADDILAIHRRSGLKVVPGFAS